MESGKNWCLDEPGHPAALIAGACLWLSRMYCTAPRRICASPLSAESGHAVASVRRQDLSEVDVVARRCTRRTRHDRHVREGGSAQAWAAVPAYPPQAPVVRLHRDPTRTPDQVMCGRPCAWCHDNDAVGNERQGTRHVCHDPSLPAPARHCGNLVDGKQQPRRPLDAVNAVSELAVAPVAPCVQHTLL